MTGAEFKAARKKLGVFQLQLAVLLDTPRSTIQDWEYGKSRIPGHMAVLMGLLLERDEKIMQEVVDRLKARIGALPKGGQ